MPNRPVHALIAVFACDLGHGGETLGSESVWRAFSASRVFNRLENGTSRATIIVSAGMADPIKFPAQTETMAELQRKFLIMCGVPSERIYVPDVGWGTEYELLMAVEEAREINSKKVRTEIHVVSSWYHIPRIKMLARLVFNTSVIAHSTKGKKLNGVIEILKLPLHTLVALIKGIRG